MWYLFIYIGNLSDLITFILYTPKSPPKFPPKIIPKKHLTSDLTLHLTYYLTRYLRFYLTRYLRKTLGKPKKKEKPQRVFHCGLTISSKPKLQKAALYSSTQIRISCPCILLVSWRTRDIDCRSRSLRTSCKHHKENPCGHRMCRESAAPA